MWHRFEDSAGLKYRGHVVVENRLNFEMNQSVSKIDEKSDSYSFLMTNVVGWIFSFTLRI